MADLIAVVPVIPVTLGLTGAATILPQAIDGILGLNAQPVYILANWKFDARLAKFDDTCGTWLTDFGICLWMLYCAWRAGRWLRPEVAAGTKKSTAMARKGPNKISPASRSKSPAGVARHRKRSPAKAAEEEQEAGADESVAPAAPVDEKTSVHNFLVRSTQTILVLYAWSVGVGGLMHLITLRGLSPGEPVAAALNTHFFVRGWLLCVVSVALTALPQAGVGKCLHARALMRYREAVALLQGADKAGSKTALTQLEARRWGLRVLRCVEDIESAPVLLRPLVALLRDSAPNPKLWAAHAATMAYVIGRGDVSFQRPAADIFCIGGFTAIAHSYILIGARMDWDSRALAEGVEEVLGGNAKTTTAMAANGAETRKASLGNIPTPARTSTGGAAASTDAQPQVRSQPLAWMLTTAAFTANSLLLTVYPVLVSLGWPLGVVNAFLHAWLTVVWGLQWWVLDRHYLSAVDS